MITGLSGAVPMLLVQHPSTYTPERKYILGVVLEHYLGLQYAAIEHGDNHLSMSLSGDASEQRLVLSDALFQTPPERWLKAASLPQQPLKCWNLPPDVTAGAKSSSPLPVIYGGDPSLPGFMTFQAGQLKLDLDVFGSAFFMLSRYEEIAAVERDQHDRFSAKASLAYQEGFIDRPLVDEYVEILRWALHTLWPGLPFRRHEYRLRLTHDVDKPFAGTASPTRLIRDLAADFVRRRSPNLAARRVRSWVSVRTGHREADMNFCFGWIMDQSERLGLQSAFYFITAQTAGPIDGTYSIDDPFMRALLRRIHRRGHEIGLHPSYNAFRDPEQLTIEFGRLRVACEAEGIAQDKWGGRQHYLRWEAPTTWQIWDDIGLSYDTSVGFADYAGFRCGTCRAYPVFDLLRRKRLALLEKPLIVMDGSLFTPTYMNLTPEHGAAHIAMLSERCRLLGGEFVLLWHNNYLQERWQRALYLSVLDGSA
jgi:hypothetical protein